MTSFLQVIKKVFNFSVYAFRDGKTSIFYCTRWWYLVKLGYGLKNEIIKCYNKALLISDVWGYHIMRISSATLEWDWNRKGFWGTCAWENGQVGACPGKAVNSPTFSNPWNLYPSLAVAAYYWHTEGNAPHLPWTPNPAPEWLNYQKSQLRKGPRNARGYLRPNMQQAHILTSSPLGISISWTSLKPRSWYISFSIYFLFSLSSYSNSLLELLSS